MTTTKIKNLTTTTSMPCIDLSQIPSNIKAKADTAANIRDNANRVLYKF